MPKHIKNIYKTTYDGFIICTHKNDDTIETYEGKTLCPDWLKNWLNKKELNQLK